MNDFPAAARFTTPHFDLQLLETAKHRAAALRQAAIAGALDHAAAVPAGWWRRLRRALGQRSRLRHA